MKTRALGFGKYPRLHYGAALHAKLAFDIDRCRRDPTSIIATFAFNESLWLHLINVTMLALVLMVGVVIDDAIVVLEKRIPLHRRKRMDPIRASIEGTREIGLAVLAPQFSLVIVFLPVSFLSSVTGRMLYEFGVTAPLPS